MRTKPRPKTKTETAKSPHTVSSIPVGLFYVAELSKYQVRNFKSW